MPAPIKWDSPSAKLTPGDVPSAHQVAFRREWRSRTMGQPTTLSELVRDLPRYGRTIAHPPVRRRHRDPHRLRDGHPARPRDGGRPAGRGRAGPGGPGGDLPPVSRRRTPPWPADGDRHTDVPGQPRAAAAGWLGGAGWPPADQRRVRSHARPAPGGPRRGRAAGLHRRGDRPEGGRLHARARPPAPTRRRPTIGPRPRRWPPPESICSTPRRSRPPGRPSAWRGPWPRRVGPTS